MNKELEYQIIRTEEALKPNAKMHEGVIEFTQLIKLFYQYLKETIPMKEKLIKKKKEIKKAILPKNFGKVEEVEKVESKMMKKKR